MTNLVNQVWQKYLGVNTPEAALLKQCADRISTLEDELAESRARVAESDRVLAWTLKAAENAGKERDAAHAATEQMREAIIEMLAGIDKTEVEVEGGWWETSSGANFGACIIEKIRALPVPDGAKVLAERDAEIERLKGELQHASLDYLSASAQAEEHYKNLTAAHAAIEVARTGLRAVYEVWAGSEGIPAPTTASEAYLLKLVEDMRDEAKDALAQLNALDGSCVDRIKDK